MDEPLKPAVIRLETQNAKLVKIDCGGETFITTEASLSRYPNTLLGDPEVKHLHPVITANIAPANLESCLECFSFFGSFCDKIGVNNEIAISRKT